MIADAAHWERVERVLDAVFDSAPDRRDAVLESSCAGDPRLRRDVERLLTADERAGEFLAHPPPWHRGPVERQAPHPARIGPFRIVEELGRGGMGVVYLADRMDGQFEQRVALKCIAGATNIPDVERRFLQERGILARLEHPNIARLLDGGMTADGRPFFAMERVDGEPITDYCEHHGLDVHGKLELFLDVCHAVEYAHRRLVVHRDLKPSNILVSSSGQVKLLDFGLAKLFDRSDDDGLATATQHRLLTPVYAAPEQLLGQPATTATDVYGLGMLLYELVAGRRPFEWDGRSVADYTRDVLEKEPPRTGLSGVAWRADIDAICLKALRKEPELRYSSVDALRADVERLRAGQPVDARHGDAAYRLRKFLGRHRVESLAALLVLGTVVAGAAVAVVQARVASSERRRAELINEFFVEEMIGAAAPEETRGREVSVREVLDAAARRVEDAFRDEPEMEAAVRSTLGRTYRSLGLVEQAEEQLSAAAVLFAAAFGPDAPAALRARADLAALKGHAGDRDRAVEELQAILAVQSTALGAEHVDTLRTRRLLADAQVIAGQYLKGQQAFEEVLEALDRAHPGAVRERLAAMTGLCGALQNQRRNDRAERTCSNALDLQLAEFGRDHPDTLQSEVTLAKVLGQLDRYEEATRLLEDSLSDHERVLGREHEATLRLLNLLGGMYYDTERVDDAHRVWAEALARSEAALGPGHQTTIFLVRNVALASRARSDFETAEHHYKLALQRLGDTLGPAHPRTLKVMKMTAAFLLDTGKRDEAVALFEEEIRLANEAAARPDAEPTLLNDHAWFLLTGPVEALRDPPLALRLAARAVELTERRQPVFLDTLAHAHHRSGDLERAIEVEREALALPDSLHRYDLERTMVGFLVEAGRPDDAERFLREHLERRRAGRPEGDPTIGETLRLLGLHAAGRYRYEEADSWFSQAREHFRRGLGSDSWRECRVLGDIADSLLARRRPDEAVARYREAVSCAEPWSGKRGDLLADLKRRLADAR